MISNLIDLSRIEPPAAVEKLSYETILTEMAADLKVRYPDFSALVESDPAYKVLEICAYREVMLRQRINDGAKAVMLAYASGSDLDNLGALFNTSRLCIDKGNDTLVPPVPPLWESDAAFRKRILLALEGITTAGSIGSYIFHALNSHAQVKDVSVQSPNPGEVLITVLGRSGVPDQNVLASVESALNAENVRPLTDHVTVQGAKLTKYTITAKVTLESGISKAVMSDAVRERLSDFTEEQNRLGAVVPLSGIYAAIHGQTGVRRVVLSIPDADVVTTPSEAPFCETIKLEFADE